MEGFTGSEIEQAFIDALYSAFTIKKEPTDLNIIMTLNNVVPLSRLMEAKISQLRKWAKGRTRPATKQETAKTGRKIAAMN